MAALIRVLPPLLLLLAATSTGCGVFAGASPTPTPTLTPTATRTPTPTSTPTATPTPTPEPVVETASLAIAQGGYGVLRVSGSAASAVATFDGRDYPLLPSEDGFWGVIGVPADRAAGTYPVAYTLFDSRGLAVADLLASVVVVDTPYPVEEIALAPEQSALLDPALSQREAATRAAIYSVFTPERYWSGVFIVPVPGPISSPYGIGRSYNGAPVTSFHHGTDYALDEGTPVVASNAGVVAFAGELPIRGASVIIDHGAGVFTAYHHLLSVTVAEGGAVATGDLVGYVGASGLATGPHLHWEVVVAGVEVDPVLWTHSVVGP